MSEAAHRACWHTTDALGEAPAATPRCTRISSRHLDSRVLLIVGLIAAASPNLTRAQGDCEVETRAAEVRAFIDAVAGGIETLQIPEDIHDLPQPRLPGGEIDPLYEITEARVELGRLLFHDPTFTVLTGFPETELTGSCATCHFVEAGFRAGQAQCFGVGGRRFLDESGTSVREPIPSLWAIDEGPTGDFNGDAVDNPAIVSPSINMVAYFDELLWNGAARQETPEESPPVERQARNAFGAHRLDDTAFEQVPEYVPLFEEAFPELADEPVEVLIDMFQIIRAISAYERTVVSNHAPWDAFLAGDDLALTCEELDGAELFWGEAGCSVCHGGPALGSTTYHALGVAEHAGLPDGEHDLGRFAVTSDPADMFKFRAMTVRNLKGTGPFFHGGSAGTVEDVVRYKNAAAPDQKIDNLSPLFVPLGLSEQEILDLTAFLSDGLNDPDMERFSVDSLPSGLCVPNDDLPSRYDAECELFGDFDEDGDVDLMDYGHFQRCFNSPQAHVGEQCAPMDRDGDEDVDLDDYTAFQAALNASPAY